jgi:hypothetical protein
MATSNQLIRVYRAEYPVIRFTLTTGEDISAWTLQFTVAAALNSPTKVLEKACVVTSGPLGTFTCTLTDVETDIAPGNYYFDVWRTDAGFEELLGEGRFTILPAAGSD